MNTGFQQFRHYFCCICHKRKFREKELPERDAEDAIPSARTQPEIRDLTKVDFTDHVSTFSRQDRWLCSFAEPNMKDQK
jgi:hypothetical protein